MLKLVNIKKEFQGKVVLNDISLELPNKGLVLLSGQNGSGKTTLLNIIGGLDTPTSGYIEIDNKKLSLKEKDLCKYREEYISYIFQDNNLFDNLSVEENINIIGKSDRFEEIIKVLKLENIMNQKAKSLSGGERQRVAIARAITKDSSIILADEPTASIDAESKNIILKLLKELSKSRLVILISHDKIEISDFEDEIIYLDQGKVKIVRKSSVSDSAFKISNKKTAYNFDILNFAKNNFIADKKKTVRNSILLMITFLLLLLISSLSSLDFNMMLVDTLKLENDNLVMFKKTNSRINYFKEDEIKFLKNNINSENLEVGYRIEDNYHSINFEIDYGDNSNSFFKPLNDLYFFNAKLIEPDYGRKPNKDDEIVISSYLADLIIQSNSDKGLNSPDSYENIVNEYSVKLGNHSVHIVGVYKVNLPSLQEMNRKNVYKREMFAEIIRNSASNVYVTDGFFNIYDDIEKVIDIDNFVFPYKELQPNQTSFGGYDQHSFKIFKSSVELTDGTLIEEMNDNEIIVNTDVLDYWKLKANDCIGKEIEFNIGDNYNNNVGKIKGVVKGVSVDNNIYINQNNIPNYLLNNIKIRKVMLHEDNRETLNSLINKYPLSYGENTYVIWTNYSKNFEDLKYYCEVLKIFSIIITIIFSVISIYFLFNYVKSNVELHNKNIAILKSLGVSNFKIMLTFLYKTINLTIIAFIYALLSFIILRFIINTTVSNILAFKVNIIPISLYLLLIPILSLVINYILSLLTFNKIKRIYPQTLLKKI